LFLSAAEPGATRSGNTAPRGSGSGLDIYTAPILIYRFEKYSIVILKSTVKIIINNCGTAEAGTAGAAQKIMRLRNGA
jgi:hypothetical protein